MSIYNDIWLVFHYQISFILVFKCQHINLASLVLLSHVLSPENLAIRNLFLNGLTALPGAIFKLFYLYFDKTSHEVNNKLEHKYLSSSKIKWELLSSSLFYVAGNVPNREELRVLRNMSKVFACANKKNQAKGH